MDNRFLADYGSACKMSVDGTNFKIQQPQIFETKWFSHKFKGPGLRYEVALNIQTGDIVWSHGPFPPGAHMDLAIFLQGLAHKLEPGERVEADKGYGGGQGLLTVPTQLFVQGPYSDVLRQTCAQGMSCVMVGSKYSRF